MQIEVSSAAEVFACGEALLKDRTIPEAIECFNEAQRLGFDAAECAARRWDCWMLSGQLERAWEESDRIAASGAPDQHRFWLGQPWHGKRVMLRCLHGLGDTIQFIRYAPLLRATCCWLTVQTHPQLVTLIEGVPGVDNVITWGPGVPEEQRDWDIQMEIMELPRAFRTSLCSAPSSVPYINIPEERAWWAKSQFAGTGTSGLRIGLVWESGSWDSARSIPLRDLWPLFISGDHEFYCLQKGADIREFQQKWPLRDLESRAVDVRDTAALIQHLDLVVSVDTMTAHLAGALGRPVWILLPLHANWRWMMRRNDTPWYPTARLFRQHNAGNWREVIDNVRQGLDNVRQGLVDSESVLRHL
jgi:hypothetical protein